MNDKFRNSGNFIFTAITYGCNVYTWNTSRMNAKTRLKVWRRTINREEMFNTQPIQLT